MFGTTFKFYALFIYFSVLFELSQCVRILENKNKQILGIHNIYFTNYFFEK